MAYSVYRHTAPNGKVYIGITSKNPLDRWKNGHGYKGNPHFINAIVKYGWDNFSHEILYSDLTRQEACRIEVELIARHKSNDPQYGYNRTPGGDCGNVGVVISDEMKQKISAKLTGRKLSKEHIQHSAEGHRGLKRNEETKRRIRESAIKRGVSEATRMAQRMPVICVETNQIYPSITNAAEQTGISRRQINNVCCGWSKTAGGYTWKHLKTKEMR